MKEQLWYLASPYSHPDPAVREARFRQICEVSAHLMAGGVMLYAPIAHTHPIALAGALPTGWDFWREYDKLYLERCDGLLVCCMDGWQQSRGVQDEIAMMRDMRKRILHFLPGNPTAIIEFLKCDDMTLLVQIAEEITHG